MSLGSVLDFRESEQRRAQVGGGGLLCSSVWVTATNAFNFIVFLRNNANFANAIFGTALGVFFFFILCFPFVPFF